MGSAEANILQELVTAIEQPDQPVTDEIQAVVEKAKRPPERPVIAKSVRQAFDKLEKKRKNLNHALKARKKLHTSWTNYIEESVTSWKQFAADFTAKDPDLEKKVIEAREAVQEARNKYDAAKEANDKQDAAALEDVEEISDGMDEDQVDKIASAEDIKAGIQSSLDSLESFRVTPLEAHPEAMAHKKQKTGGGEEDPHCPGSSALKPFHQPGGLKVCAKTCEAGLKVCKQICAL